MSIMSILAFIGMVYFATIGGDSQPLGHNFTVMFIAFCILYSKTED